MVKIKEKKPTQVAKPTKLGKKATPFKAKDTIKKPKLKNAVELAGITAANVSEVKLAKVVKPKKAKATKAQAAEPLKAPKPVKQAKKEAKKKDDVPFLDAPNTTQENILKTKPTKKAKKPASRVQEEEKFGIPSADINRAITGIVKLVRDNPKLKTQLFTEKFPLFLQVNTVKAATGHAKLIRIPLKHSLLTPDDEVCLIVADVKGFKNKEHDKHLDHYEELLARKGVRNIKKIMTFHEFRTEYETFELRSRLVDLYDYFLADAKISGKVVAKCGKVFYDKRKVPNPIKMRATKLKQHIEQSLLKTQFLAKPSGDSFMVQFGHSQMETGQLVENVYSLLEGLQRALPGGYKNVRNLQVYAQHAPSIPIYLNLASANEVKIEALKERRVQKRVQGELSTVVNADVIVTAENDVRILKRNVKKQSPDEYGIEDLLRLPKDLTRTRRRAYRNPAAIRVDDEKTLKIPNMRKKAKGKRPAKRDGVKKSPMKKSVGKGRPKTGPKKKKVK